MAKKAATKKTPATAKTPKRSIAPSPTPPNTDTDPLAPGTDSTREPMKSRPPADRRKEAGGEADNRATPPTDTEGEGENAGDKPHTPLTEPKTSGENQGDDRFSSGNADPPAAASQVPPQLALACARLPGEGRAACWERLRKAARAVGMPRGQGPGTAYEWATRETDRLFPPVEPAAREDPPGEPEPPAPETNEEQPEAAQPAPIAVAPAPKQDDQGVSGLGDLPPSWPELPANAQLQVEIAWVTANRLRVRDGTGVNLSRALSPAPSYSALSWLETSILFPAKFADISVKATATTDDEKEFIRREKLSIEEMRSILAEMLEG